MLRRRLPQDRPARARDALGGRGLRRADRAAARRADRPLAHPARRPGRLRRDPARRHGRRLPDREPRADAEPAAHAAREPRRPDRPGRARPARADPGQGRAPVHRAPRSGCARTRRFVPPVDHPLLREPLRETLGVVVFQDQVLDVAMALAGFTRRRGGGAAARDEPQAQRGGDRGVSASASSRARRRTASTRATANAVYDKLVGFSGFGFPKSHAAAFGLLAYQSAWLRHHYPAEFLCALLNAQPMGFYPPATLVRDAQRRGVEVRPPDVNRARRSARSRTAAVRIGLEYVASLGEDDAEAVVAERERGRAVPRRRRPGAARAGSSATRSRRSSQRRLRLPRRAAARRCSGSSASSPRPQNVPGSGGEAQQLALPLEPDRRDARAAGPDAWERMLADYRCTSVSVGVHPLELLRPHLPAGVLSSAELRERRTARASPRGHGRRAPAPVDRERRSSSCCSRTSSAR